ncbi:MAG: ester cyclase family protein [Chloroflexota bacterium]
MSTQKNLDLVLRMYDALNAKDLEAHHNYWHDDMIWHGPPGFGDIPGIDGFKYEVLKPFYATFPDYYVKDEIQIANGDWVAATGVLTGTPQDEWLGVPATGKSIVMRYSDFWRVEDGKLAENWVMVDNFGVMQQLANADAKPWVAARKHIYQTPSDPTTAQQTLDLVTNMMEALNSHDREAQHQHWHEDMIVYGPPGFGDIHGVEAFKTQLIEPLYTAFPDFHIDREVNGLEMIVADDHWAVATGMIRGTHRGDWFNISPTGKQISISYSNFWRSEGGKLAESWLMIDQVGLMDQLGVNPLELQY